MNKKWLICLFTVMILLEGCESSVSHANTEHVKGTSSKTNEITSERMNDAKEYLKLKLESYENDIDASILNVPLINQMSTPKLFNGCEVSSLAMILNDSGIKVTKNELAKQIPRVPLTYQNGLHGNPNTGFVGNMEVGPGLTVYHGPIKALAAKYAGDRAQDLTGKDISVLYQKIDDGIPVWVITTSTFSPVHDFKQWNTPEGKINITKHVHSVVITGYDENHVYINNPFGIKNQRIDKENFEKAWEQMGKQAIIIAPPLPYPLFRAS